MAGRRPGPLEGAPKRSRNRHYSAADNSLVDYVDFGSRLRFKQGCSMCEWIKEEYPNADPMPYHQPKRGGHPTHCACKECY